VRGRPSQAGTHGCPERHNPNGDLHVALGYDQGVLSPLVALVLLAAGEAAGEPARPAYLPGAAPAKRPGPGLELRREPGKGWVYEHPGFFARVAEDGTVRFEDRHGEIHIALPIPLPMPEGTPTLEGSLRKLVNPHARPRTSGPAPSPEYPLPVPRVSPYLPDATEWCRYPNPCYFNAAVMVVAMQGTFDINDEILRLAKKDPYRNQKAAFLASTLALRQELGERAASRARARALDELRKRLDAIDADPKLDAPARRAAIQAVADELDPDPAVAAPARALIDARLQGKK